MKVTVIIPARYGSSRFPGKPLVQILGKSLLQRVFERVSSSPSVGEVFISTDDDRIVAHSREFGAKAIKIDSACRNGTERTQRTIELLGITPEVIVNVQGDNPLFPPLSLSSLGQLMASDTEVELATPAIRLTWDHYDALSFSKKDHPFSGTLVAFDSNRDALYFSKNFIPSLRKREGDLPYVFRHIGMYAYRFDTLKRLANLPPSPLEIAEDLEQLRALENGIAIRIVEVPGGENAFWSVDTPEDLKKVEAIIKEQGES